MKKDLVNIKEINNIQQYFKVLFQILKQFFESQHSKINLKTGYDFRAYQLKTEYRIKFLLIPLKKIMKIENKEFLVRYIKKKKKSYKKFTSNYSSCDVFDKNECIEYFIGRVLEDYCEDFLCLLKNSDFSLEYLQNSLLETFYEDLVFYKKELDATLIVKYGPFALTKNIFYKEKSITQRLKKSR